MTVFLKSAAGKTRGVKKVTEHHVQTPKNSDVYCVSEMR